MATQLQIRRGTSSQVAAFTGAEGEIVVNTTNDSVHVNDGSTAGGFELARADLNNVSDTSLNAALTGNTVSALTITTLTLGSTAITATGAEINILDGVTATAAELNILDGVTSTAAELNILDGVTATTAELNYVDGVTSAIQTQLDAKAPLASPTFTGTVTVPGLTTTADVSFADNDKAIFGAGSDLQIYHDGSNSFIKDAGTGILFVQGSGGVRVLGADTSENLARFNENDSVQLYYNNAEKLATTSTGIDVSGSVTATGLTVGTSGTNAEAYFNNGAKTYRLLNRSSDNAFSIFDDSSSAFRLSVATGGDISFFDTSGNAAVFFDASAGNLLVGKTSTSIGDAGHTIFASGEVFHTVAGTPLYVNRTGSDGPIQNFYKDGSTVGSISAISGEVSIGRSGVGIMPIGSSSTPRVVPSNHSSGAVRDSAVDLGASNARWSDLYLSGGAYLGGTAAANKLDDYEEGTWTPLIQRVDGNVAASFTVGSGSARYTKIGNTVHLIAFMHSISNGSSNGSSYWVIYGIPFNGQVIDYSGAALAYNSTGADAAYVGDASGNAILTSGSSVFSSSISGAFMLNITYKIT